MAAVVDINLDIRVTRFQFGRERLGFVIGTLIASGLILRILSVKSWRVLVITSLGLSIGTYLLFDRLLGIDLPMGMLARFHFMKSGLFWIF